MNQSIVYVASKMETEAPASPLLNHSYIDCIEYGRRDDRFSKRRSQLPVRWEPQTMNGKYTIYRMAIGQNSFKNEGWVRAAIL